MTKKIDVAAVMAEQNMSVDHEATMYERALQEKRDAVRTRQSALQAALDFHKNNGGMHHAANVVTTADTFLTFIKGETK